MIFSRSCSVNFAIASLSRQVQDRLVWLLILSVPAFPSPRPPDGRRRTSPACRSAAQPTSCRPGHQVIMVTLARLRRPSALRSIAASIAPPRRCRFPAGADEEHPDPRGRVGGEAVRPAAGRRGAHRVRQAGRGLHETDGSDRKRAAAEDRPSRRPRSRVRQGGARPLPKRDIGLRRHRKPGRKAPEAPRFAPGDELARCQPAGRRKNSRPGCGGTHRCRPRRVASDRTGGTAPGPASSAVRATRFSGRAESPSPTCSNFPGPPRAFRQGWQPRFRGRSEPRATSTRSTATSSLRSRSTFPCSWRD